MWNIWDFLFPPTCLHCGDYVHRMGDWCEVCFENLYKCEIQGDGKNLYIDEIITLGAYEGGLKRMFHDVKFNGKKERARGAAPFLHRFSKEELCKSLMPDYVVPVPTSYKKLKERGYNQVDLFFYEWVQYMHAHNPQHWIWLDCAYKLDNTKAMWGLSRKDREKNLDGAFLMKEEYRHRDMFKNAQVLIVDDIYTTGATIRELGKILHSYNPSSIKALSIAGGT